MACEISASYPAQYETEVILKDGSRIFLRPIRREDTEQWLAFVQGLSDYTKYTRFHYLPRELSLEDAIRFCSVDYVNSFAFVAEALQKDQGKSIVAIGRYYRLPNRQSAEIAIVIDDAYQRRGIGTKLLERLATVARDNGITAFEAEVSADNEQMLRVFQDYGFHITSELKGGVYHISFPIARLSHVVKKEEERERLSTVVSLRSILSPKSIAVIGASRAPGSIGYLILHSIIQNGYTGVVYPVNPNAGSIMSVKAYPSILDVPGEVELAIIVVPAQIVPRVADECGRKGVRAVIVISDGFKERGPEGAARERELRDITLGHGMRLVGPNCMGVINTDPAVSLNATFSRVYPPRGNVAFLSQSGAMGLVILQHASDLNMGISSFVSVGNRADISPNDLLQYWEEDPATQVVLLYLESFGNPRKFSRIAKSASTKKPIVVVKSGTTLAGSRAAASHTGALATSEFVSEALFRQAGILRMNSIEELFDVATLLSNQPLPRGRRLAIVTNGGGPGIIAADASEEHGLILPELSTETKEKLGTIIKREITFDNPLDMTAGVSPEEFENVLRVLAADKNYDAVLFIFMPVNIINPQAMEDAIRRVIPLFQRRGKPLLACFMGQRGFKSKLGVGGKFVPSYLFPEDAVLALAKAAEYCELAKKPRGSIPRIKGIRRTCAERIVTSAMTRSDQRPLWLSAEEIAGLLRCYGIRFVETAMAKTADEAAALAAKIGFPVVVKLHSSTIVHKTDVGGVVLDIRSEEEVKKAFNDIRARLVAIGREGEMDGVTVQRMVKEGIEATAGVTQDPSFGPLIMFGLGGIYAELLKDVALRLHPLTDLDAKELVESIKMSKLFDGFRGSPPSDKEAVQDLLLRLSALVEDVPQIAELDLNPVKVLPQGQGYWVVDARILVK